MKIWPSKDRVVLLRIGHCKHSNKFCCCQTIADIMDIFVS